MLTRCRSWTGLIICCAVGYCCVLAIFVGVCFPEFSSLVSGLLLLFVRENTSALFYAFSQSHRHFSKPVGIEIVALVPFYRADEMEILDCYLVENLASNNGFLDRVVFIPQSNDTRSLEWLTSAVEQTSSYSISHDSEFSLTADTYDNTLFVWIDGDIVFLEDHTVPTMVKTKLDHPDVLLVSANTVNQGPLEALHSHPSIALPYIPEPQVVRSSAESSNWRASSFSRCEAPAESQTHDYRWVLSDDEDFEHTPIGMSIYSETGPGLEHWTVKTQQHYSFLYHLELGDLHRYKFPIWANPLGPISTNFFCFMGGDAATVQSFLQQNGPYGQAPVLQGSGSSGVNSIIIDGKGLAAHYSHELGADCLDHADILQRYRSYAREMVCPETA
ncbi:hypothetical protein BJX61DRAFT_532740 [Aspergillus egyptiacus]|nr:hypothetical protein BJX61DRAFT_532740 [Aspergillus egyptiacus]